MFRGDEVLPRHPGSELDFVVSLTRMPKEWGADKSLCGGLPHSTPSTPSMNSAARVEANEKVLGNFYPPPTWLGTSGSSGVHRLSACLEW